MSIGSKAAGVGEREARALAEGLDQALREEVATKSDLAAVKADSPPRSRRRSTMCCAGWSVWRSPKPSTVALIRFLPH
jgi:hypothetical protein